VGLVVLGKEARDPEAIMAAVNARLGKTELREEAVRRGPAR
jgi:hypothetical protein